MSAHHRQTRRTLIASSAALLAAPSLLRAQSWRPSKPMRIVVPAAPAGTTDIVARLLGAYLQEKWGQTVVIDNKSGGGGTIGTIDMLRAPADGHTLLMGNIGPQGIAYSLYRGLPYKAENIVGISGVVTTPNALVVHPSVPANNVAEFVAWLRAQDGKVSYASSGTGQSPHLSGAWFLQLVKAKATHVPYRGAAPALNDLVANVTQYFFDNLTTAIEFVRAGRLRGLAVTSVTRNAKAPELPPLRETLPELAPFDVSAWFGVFAAAAVPRPAIEALNAEVRAWLATPTMQTRIEQMAGTAQPTSIEDYATFVAAEIAKWRGVIEKEGLQLDIN